MKVMLKCKEEKYGPIDRFSVPGLYVNKYGNWYAIVPPRTDHGDLIYIHSGTIQVSGGGEACYKYVKPIHELTLS
jgi:hypothetical protein